MGQWLCVDEASIVDEDGIGNGYVHELATHYFAVTVELVESV